MDYIILNQGKMTKYFGKLENPESGILIIN